MTNRSQAFFNLRPTNNVMLQQMSRPLCRTQPAKIDLNKKSLPKQKTIQNFDIDAQVFRKTRNENPSSREIGVTS